MTAQNRIEEYIKAITAALSGGPLPEYPAAPAWRTPEEFLAAILSAALGESPVRPCPDPAWRFPDEFLRAIYDAMTGADPAWPCPVPTTRLEEYLRAAYERAASGTETPIIAPVWNIEEFIAEAVAAIPTEQTYGPAALVSFETSRAKLVKSLLIDLQPIQDLHGYDHPWPAGGGVNLLPSGGAFDVTVNGIRFVSDGTGKYTITGTATADAGYNFDIEEVTLPSTVFVHMLNDVSTYNVAFAFFSGNTQIAAPASVPVNSIKDLSVKLGGQTLNKLRIFVSNGYTANITLSPMLCVDDTVKPFYPYSNICPISGRTGANAYRTGKNLLKNSLNSGTYTGLECTVNDDGSVVLNGTSTAAASITLLSQYATDKPTKGDFILSGCPAGGASNTYRLICNKNNGGQFVTDTGNGATFSLSESDTYNVYIRFNSGVSFDHVVFRPMIRVATDPDNTYEPYQGNVYPVTFGEAGTVYAGSVDVVSGVLKSSSYYPSYNGETLVGPWISSMDEYTPGGTPTTGAQVVDLGGAETETQLTPQEVQTLVGTNNVWSDSGDVTVKV